MPLLAACNPEQSALHPAGEAADDVALLFWVMAAGTVIIWLIVMGAAVYAVLGRKRPSSERFADRFTLVGGVVFPVTVLAGLLLYGLSLLPSWSDTEPADLRIHVTGEQFWWRITYELADGTRLETANEVHLPVGATAEFVIESSDVIHSFWIPPLGGKMDAIPGRTNLLRLRPTKVGIYRGICAEFCGTSHAFMALDVRVHDQAGYDAWLDAQRAPASAAEDGAALFVASGCAACHTVRGVVATAAIGPDLTHVGSRASIAAGTLPNTPEALRAWIENPKREKPGALMPAFGALPDEDIGALVAFLTELR